MNIRIHNFTGYENECDVDFYEVDGKYSKSYYLIDLDIEKSMDREGFGNVKINNVKCQVYDDQDNVNIHILTEEEISVIEYEMKDYIDWEEWIESKRPDED
jgi:hypothetical protein